MKYFRLKKKKEITKILKAGTRVHSGSLTVVFFASDVTKMAVCVGKKFGKSVQRNRIKRLLREAFSCHAEKIVRPQSFLLIPRVKEQYSFDVFRRDLGNVLKKEKLVET